MSNQQDAPKIEFPCDYPIRVLGISAPDYKECVTTIVKQHAPDFCGKVEVKDSRNGRFQSVLVTIRATGEAQLKALYADLKATGRVHMVL